MNRAPRIGWLLLTAWALAAAAPARADVLYVSESAGTVVTYNTTGGGPTTFATGLNEPDGLAFDGKGNLYVANYGNSTIEKITPGGTSTQFAATGPNGVSLSHPYGLAFDGTGNLYVANAGNNTIEMITSAGEGSVFAADKTNGVSLSFPIGLAFDGKGNLYVANNGNNTIEMITSAGEGSQFAANGADVNAPLGLAFDSAGNLFAANFGDKTIEKFPSAGAPSQFAATSSSPEFLAFQPQMASVPEPSALALAGLAAALGLGGAAWRRRRVAAGSARGSGLAQR